MLTAKDVIALYFTDSNGKARMTLAKLYRLANRNEIPAKRLDGRWYFNREALDKFFSCEEFFVGKVAAKRHPCYEPIPE